MTQIGVARLRHRVAIQARDPAQDSFGQQSGAWTTTATVWADVEPVSGREQQAGGAELASVTHMVTMRYRSWVTARHRLVYAGRIFDIESVLDVGEAHFWLQIGCTEGLNKG